MPYEQKDNTGTLFKNDKEGGNPNWPDYKGSIIVNGVDYWLSAWIKEGKKGKFMSLSVKVRDGKPAQSQKRPDPTDDQIPF